MNLAQRVNAVGKDKANAILNQQTIKEAVKKDCWFWLQEFAKTLDMHDYNVKVKPFPNYPYLKYLIHELQYGDNYLLVPKSRKLMITWAVVDFYYWLAMYHPGEYILFQCQKEEKAGWGGTEKGDPEALLSRGYFTYRNLPVWLKVRRSISKKPPMIVFTHIVNGVEIPSTIHAISSDCDDFRQFSPTAIFMDEVAFQLNASRAYGAAQPALGAKCRITGVSTMNGKEFFYNLVNDSEW